MAVALSDRCYQVGREIIVKYAGPETHWHRRMLIQASTPESLTRSTGEVHHGGPLWWIMTRDKDIYVEELALTPSIAGIRGCNLHGVPQADQHLGSLRHLNRVLGFTLPRPGEFMDMVRGVAQQEAPLIPGGLPAPLGPPVLPEGGGGGDGGVPRPDGDDGLLQDLDAGKADWEDEDLDARVLSVARSATGERRRDFRTVKDDLTESEWAGWPLNGPRTVRWVVDYIAATDGNPRGRHTRWKRDANLKTGDAGVAAHEMAMRALQFAIEFDQLNVSELSSMEFLCRQTQLSELKHRERMIQADPSDDYGEDSYLYLGISQTRGQVMMHPALEEFVSSQLEKEGRVLKERRKLQEERKLTRGGGASAETTPAQGGRGKK